MDILNQNKFLIIHHTSVSREKQKAQFYPVNRYHKEKWNMKSKLGYYHGYTHFMGTNGVITQTRDLNEEGMHTLKYNKSGHIALCIAGDFNVEMPNKEQIKSLKKFIRNNKEYKIKFHSELTENRICPGKLFTRDWFEFEFEYTGSETVNFDYEDTIKKAKIQKLSSVIDSLMEIVLNLLKSLNNKKL